ncbi:hypothetical protein QWA68_016795 [Fusarium oxysporum]|nr:hypothetical protein QWA68_016795 [Fusarium oxysporum]
MKVSILFGNAVFFGAALVDKADARYCFDSGEAMHMGTIKFHAERACRGYSGQRGTFQGVFEPGQKKTACVNVPEQGKHLKMEVINKNKQQSFDLKDDDCYSEFVRLINGCRVRVNGPPPDHSRGGRDDVSGWHFRFDPNSGLGC